MADDGSTDPVNVIIAAGIVVTGSTLIRDAHEGKLRAAPIVFGFLMVTGLLIIGMGTPKFARGLAWLAMVGAFVVNGPAVFSIASGLSGSQTAGLVYARKGPKEPKQKEPVTAV